MLEKYTSVSHIKSINSNQTISNQPDHTVKTEEADNGPGRQSVKTIVIVELK